MLRFLYRRLVVWAIYTEGSYYWFHAYGPWEWVAIIKLSLNLNHLLTSDPETRVIKTSLKRPVVPYTGVLVFPWDDSTPEPFTRASEAE